MCQLIGRVIKKHSLENSLLCLSFGPVDTSHPHQTVQHDENHCVVYQRWQWQSWSHHHACPYQAEQHAPINLYGDICIDLKKTNQNEKKTRTKRTRRKHEERRFNVSKPNNTIRHHHTTSPYYTTKLTWFSPSAPCSSADLN